MPWLDCSIIYMCLGLCGSENEEREREGDGVTQQMYEVLVLFCLSAFSLPFVKSLIIRYLLPCKILKSKQQQQRQQKRTNKWPVRHNSVNNVLDALKRHDVKVIKVIRCKSKLPLPKVYLYETDN